MLSSPIEPCTEKTITDPDTMRLELSKIRKQGYAMEDEEFQMGLFCISAPIRGYKGRVIAAISTTIPKYRLETENIPDITKDLIETANNISDELAKF